MAMRAEKRAAPSAVPPRLSAGEDDSLVSDNF